MLRKDVLLALIVFVASTIILFSTNLFSIQKLDFPLRVTLWLLVAALIISLWLFSTMRRSRKALVAELTNRAERLQKEQQQERELAAADERSRIAREMHDIIAHSLQVIITQSDGGRYAAQQAPETAQEVFATISGTARESLKEMRRLIGILRVDEPLPMSSSPDIDEIFALIKELDGTGVTITVTEQGPRKRRERLPTGSELAIYRLAQEALTNVIKHGGPNVKVDVALEWDPGELMISIIDDGRGAAANPAPEGSGNGIRGMRERFALYGGTVVAQAKIGGGFAVHASIPYIESE